MKQFIGFERGMGIGGWLTNYKRFNVLPERKRMALTTGDFEHFRSYITEADVKYIASLGMDHIRLGFDQIVVEEAPFVYREEIFEIIENFLKWCEKYKLHVVLNLHKAIGNYCDIPEAVSLLDDERLQERFIALWLEFERRFSAYPQVAFELLNEVRNVDPDSWNRLTEKTIVALRNVNPTRTIVVGSICWGGIRELASLKTYDDPNVVYTFHMYTPFEFTHQRGVLFADPLYYNRKMVYPDGIEKYRDYHKVVFGNENAYADHEKMDYRFLCDSMQGALDFMEKHPDKILWLGEFGTIRHADITSRENYMNDVIYFCKEHEIPYCVWNYLSTPNDGNRFSLVDDDERKILSKRLGKIIRGKVVDPTRR